jgi:hypothetical protein
MVEGTGSGCYSNGFELGKGTTWDVGLGDTGNEVALPLKELPSHVCMMLPSTLFRSRMVSDFPLSRVGSLDLYEARVAWSLLEDLPHSSMVGIDIPWYFLRLFITTLRESRANSLS